MKHVTWFEKIETINTTDNRSVDIFRYNHVDDSAILEEWANHFRNHYCRDETIDNAISGTGLSRSEYIHQFVFPSKTKKPGPSTRAGDFGEILVADYLEFVLGFVVPRTRYEFKDSPNESAKGTDIIGFKLQNENEISNADELFTFEVKCALASTNNEVLQSAINDSKKDFQLRKAFSLNAIKYRLKLQGKNKVISLVERFQNQTDKPYREQTGAAAVLSEHVWDESIVSNCSIIDHPNKARMSLIIIRGVDLMSFINILYQKACDQS